MNFRLLKYFVAVASTLSFSRAAENLHVSQSTLSQQIQQLEGYYGVKLFERQGRSVSLTPAGLELQQAASRLLGEETQLKEHIRRVGSDPHIETHPLRIFFDAHMNTGPHLVGAMIDSIFELRETVSDRISFHPNFTSADMDDPNILLDDILSDKQTDIWIVGAESELKHPGIQFYTLFTDSFSLLVSRWHPLYRDNLTIDDLPDILNQSILYMIQNRSQRIKSVLDILPDSQEIDPAIHFEQTAETISINVALGYGVSVVPQSNMNENISTNYCVSIPLPDTKFYTMLGYRKDNDNPLVPMLTEIMLERFSRLNLS